MNSNLSSPDVLAHRPETPNSVRKDGDFTEYFSKLSSFAQLDKGWDSYLADPPNLRACESVHTFLEYLQRISYPPTKVAPSLIGGIGVTFRRLERTVYVEFRNTGNTHAAFIQDGGEDSEVYRVSGNEAGYAELISKITPYLR